MTTIIKAEYVVAAAPHISNEQTRYYLCGIYVEPHPSGGAFIVATDGHTMFVGHDETGTVDEPAIYPISKDLLRACKSKSTLAVTFDGETAKVQLVDFEGVTREVTAIAVCAPIDGSFPDWRRVVPKGELSGILVSGKSKLTTFLPAVITKLLATNKALGTTTFRVEADGDNPAIVRFVKRDDLFVVAMPATWGSDVEGLPEFMGAALTGS